MTSSRRAGPPEPRGSQEPRICSVPAYETSAGGEAVELAEHAGLALDPWESLALRHSLGERSDGKWAARQVGLCVPRQNGKGTVLEARALAGLFLLGEELITHSAHRFDTALEAFRRLLALIENTSDLARRVKRVSRSHGEEGIELTTGQRVRFRTRISGGGRGFTGDCLILDEAMEISEQAHGDLLPTLSARPNPQVWYTGSAVDEDVHEHGIVFARIRERGLAGDPSVAYLEWSVDCDSPEHVASEMARDPQAWAQANPGLGIRISTETVDNEQRSMSARSFAVERLGAGAWPSTDEEASRIIAEAVWSALGDRGSAPLDPVCFAFDVTPDRAKAAIGAGGRRSDGQWHIEVVEHKRGTNWVADYVEELVAQHRPASVICDAAGPAASLLPELAARGVEVRLVTAKEYAQAYGIFMDSVEQGVLHHLDTPELAEAIAGAATRSLAEALVWSRKNSSVDISPLVACTLALWGAHDPAIDSPWERRAAAGGEEALL